MTIQIGGSTSIKSPVVTQKPNQTGLQQAPNVLSTLLGNITDDQIQNTYYVGLEVDLDPKLKEKLLAKIETHQGIEPKGILKETINAKRGEKLHLTLIRPKEKDLLKEVGNHPHILREELENLGEKIQSIETDGVGKLASSDGRIAYFLVLKEEIVCALVSFRQRLKDRLEEESKRSLEIELEPYCPHITIGFIGGDVHVDPKKGEKKEKDQILTDSIVKSGIDLPSLKLPMTTLDLPQRKQVKP